MANVEAPWVCHGQNFTHWAKSSFSPSSCVGDPIVMGIFKSNSGHWRNLSFTSKEDSAVVQMWNQPELFLDCAVMQGNKCAPVITAIQFCLTSHPKCFSFIDALWKTNLRGADKCKSSLVCCLSSSSFLFLTSIYQIQTQNSWYNEEENQEITRPD